jgi:hypothetical protein
LSGGDERVAKRLERFVDAKAAAKALADTQDALRAGQKITRPKDATPEQLTQWRADNGLPAEPKGYLENLPNGLVIGDDDRPIFEDFVSSLHEIDAPPAIAHKAVEWYNKWQEKQKADLAAGDAEQAAATDAALKQEFGRDYQTNVNLRANLLASAPAAVQEAFKTARGADGKLLGDNADLTRWLVAIARDVNPIASIMPGGAASLATAQTEFAELSKLQGDQKSRYWVGPDALKLQERWRVLHDAINKAKSKAA